MVIESPVIVPEKDDRAALLIVALHYGIDQFGHVIHAGLNVIRWVLTVGDIWYDPTNRWQRAVRQIIVKLLTELYFLELGRVVSELLKLVETKFGLTPLTSRDGTSNTMLECFNFSQPPLPPVIITPQTRLDFSDMVTRKP